MYTMTAPKMPSRTLDMCDISTRIVPVQKAFSLFTRRSHHRPIHGSRLRPQTWARRAGVSHAAAALGVLGLTGTAGVDSLRHWRTRSLDLPAGSSVRFRFGVAGGQC